MEGNKILVADDSVTIQKVIRLALSNEGYEIQTVADGEEALQRIAMFRPDVVLIDISLPKRSAIEVKKAIDADEDLQSPHFVLLSSAFEKVDEASVKNADFDGRLTKPFDPAHLRQILTQVLSKTRRNPDNERHSASTDFDFSDENDLPPIEPNLEKRREKPREKPPSEDTGSQFKELDSESDIRELTSTTLKMTNLNDQEWSVNEPSLKPPSSILDQDRMTFSLDDDDFPAQPPTSRMRHSPPPPEDFPIGLEGDFSDDLQIEPSEKDAFAPPDDFPIHTQHDDNLKSFTAPPEISFPTYQTPSKDDIEKLVHEQVEEILKTMSLKMVPEIAERVIKQEIRRLLSGL